jgi:L-ribulose-5-phosphate 3-epimerase
MKLSRRHFLQNTATTLAATALGAPLFAADAKPKRQYQKAIMWDTFGMKGTVLEKFRALKAAGFHGVETASHMNQDEVVRAFEDTGLKCASVCGSRHWSKPLSSPDEKVRAEGLDALKQTLRDAKRYGATSILLVPGVANKDVTYEQCWERSIAGIRQALPLAEDLGVKIAIENVWNNFLMKPQQAKDYLAAINHPLVGWHFDIGNMVKFGPSEEWVKVLGKSILKLHIKDYGNTPDANGKVQGFGVKLMEGSVNWPAVMSELDRIGYSGWAITEQPGAQTKDAEALKEFSALLDKVLAS